MAVHWALELMHVVVVAVLAPFAYADHPARLVQPRLAVPPHVVDLAVSLGQRCLQTVSDTLAHGLVNRLDRQAIRLLLHVHVPERSVCEFLQVRQC